MHRTSLLFFLIGVILLLALTQILSSTTFPSPLRITSASSGEEMFAVYCSSCHGASAKGGSGPDLTTLAKRNDGRFPAARVKETIRGDTRLDAHGPSDMPVWGQVFRYIGSGSQLEIDVRINNLTGYIRSLQEK